MTHSDLAAERAAALPPFGTVEILAAVEGAERVLDAGCGSGRLTVSLAKAGADVTGIDTNTGQLEQARGRAEEAGVALTLLGADFNAALPFADGSFDAVASRLALMAAADPVATLQESQRVLEPGGRIVTVLWASPAENPWFGVPREAIATVLGSERAAFARAFGKLGDPEEAAAAHRSAGLHGVEASHLHERRTAPDAAMYWQELSTENGHFRRVAASLDDAERAALAAEVDRRLEPYREGNQLSLPRTLVLVTAHSNDG
ncbi:MAG: methyltransferase domain-containing protein [Thermoleophilia bacterium]|nr:methyltransferase domain-containing protein [Thermoleophilia bacterium]